MEDLISDFKNDLVKIIKAQDINGLWRDLELKKDFLMGEYITRLRKRMAPFGIAEADLGPDGEQQVTKFLEQLHYAWLEVTGRSIREADSI